MCRLPKVRQVENHTKVIKIQQMQPDLLLRVKPTTGTAGEPEESRDRTTALEVDKALSSLTVRTPTTTQTVLFSAIVDAQDTLCVAVADRVRVGVRDCVAGFNVSWLSLGPLGSGKTCGILGGFQRDSSDLDPALARKSEEAGLLSLVVQGLLLQLYATPDAPPRTLSLQAYEVYGEMIRDLLDPLSATECRLVESARDGGVVVEGATLVQIATAASLGPVLNTIRRSLLPGSAGKCTCIYRLRLLPPASPSGTTAIGR